MIARHSVLLLTLVFLTSSADFSFGQTLWTAGVGDWSTAGNWTLGAPGAATDAQVNNGGTAQILGPGALAFNVSLGASPIDSGTLDVQGGQAQFASVLAVGVFGNGALNITGGGSVSNFHGRIGRELGGTGAATVSGPGSLWQSNGDLTVGSGAGGVGTLTIEDQATVYVQNDLYISNTSSVNLNGGTLRFNTATGLSRLNYTAGTIQLAGDRQIAHFFDPFGGNPPPVISLFGSSPVISNGQGLTVEGNTTIYNNTLTVSGGAFTSQGTLQVGSGLDLLFGTLKIENGGSVAVGGDVLIQVSNNSSVSGADSNLTVAGSLTIHPTFFTQLSIANQARVYISNTLDLRDVSLLILNGGTIRFNGYSGGGDISYLAGTVQLAGDRIIGSDAAILDFFGPSPTFMAGKALVVEGTAILPASSPVTLSGGDFSAGTVLMTPGSRITNTVAAQISGAILVSTGAVIDATAADLAVGDATKVDGFYSNGRLLVGQRTVTLADANGAVLDSGALVTLGAGGSPGTLAAANGLTLDFGGNVTGFGAVDTPNSAATPLINNGHITGNSVAEPLTLSGYVKGVGTLDNVVITGTAAPGFSPATVVLGSVVYSGALEIEIGGTTLGSFDRCEHVLGASVAQLGGSLIVSLIDGFTPELGDSFEFLTAIGGVSGEFDSEILPTLTHGLGWNINYGANFVALEVAAAPTFEADFDEDGDVDGDDLTRWRNNFGAGATRTQGDADGDQDVDGADFLAWQRQLGGPSGPQAPTAPVPEPASVTLLMLTVFAKCGATRASLLRPLRSTKTGGEGGRAHFAPKTAQNEPRPRRF